MEFEFNLPGRIVFGAGKLNEAGSLIKSFGKKALIVCDPFCVTSGLTARLEKSLQEAAVDYVVYDQVIPNPTSVSVDAGAETAKENNCEFIIGFGGGSAMDTAKGVAVAATHDGSIWPYAIGEKEVTESTLPIIAITTTSGTGSQCTCFSVITNPETNQKPGMGSPFIVPKVAIVDPELMLSAPTALTLVTGFDVFTHAVEAYTSNVSSPMSDLFAEKAISLLTEHLGTAYQNGQDLNAREGMALADTCSGIAICHAVVSLGHVIAHVISGHYHDIPHGDALYSVYRETLRFNSSALKEKHVFIADQLDPGNTDVVTAFDKFFGQFDFENKLKNKNLSEDEINTIAEESFTYLKGITELNPVAATVDDARNILTASLQ